MNRAIRILGIDPGLRRTGWGVVDDQGQRAGLRCRRHREGAARRRARGTAGQPARRAGRGRRARGRRTRLRSSRRSSTATPSATLKLGQARGIALLVPARAGLSGRRIRAERGQEGDRRRRSRRKDADPGDGARAPAARRVRQRRCRGRAGDRHLPRAPPAERDPSHSGIDLMRAAASRLGYGGAFQEARR